MNPHDAAPTSAASQDMRSRVSKICLLVFVVSFLRSSSRRGFLLHILGRGRRASNVAL